MVIIIINPIIIIFIIIIIIIITYVWVMCTREQVLQSNLSNCANWSTALYEAGLRIVAVSHVCHSV